MFEQELSELCQKHGKALGFFIPTQPGTRLVDQLPMLLIKAVTAEGGVFLPADVLEVARQDSTEPEAVDVDSTLESPL